MPQPHNCEEVTDRHDEPEDDGWWVAKCACGFRTPPVPDLDLAVDVMMAHAVEAEAVERTASAKPGKQATS